MLRILILIIIPILLNIYIYIYISNTTHEYTIIPRSLTSLISLLSSIYIYIYISNHDDLRILHQGHRVLCGSRLGRTKEVVPPVPAPPTVDTAKLGANESHLWDIMAYLGYDLLTIYNGILWVYHDGIL